MKNLQKMKIIVLILSVITVDLLALSVPTNFTADTVTNSTISFTWIDKSHDEDGYIVCIKPKVGIPPVCSEQLPPNTQNYTWTGASPYTSKVYVVSVRKGTYTEESSSISVKTTHTWEGELQKCMNEELGYGPDNITHIPTKVELEGFRGLFSCNAKGFDSMNPIVDLKNITMLVLHDNNITDTIPNEIGQLTALEYLELGKNNLTGPIPTEIGQLTNLKYLYLLNNNLSGEIPTEIGQLTNLTNLNLSQNQLTGTIPVEIGQLTNLTYLNLYRNRLTGTIPVWIVQLVDLTTFAVSENQLTGTIPAELRQLTNLKELHLSKNNLSGEIPTWIGQMTDLTILWLHNNKLTGSIPPEIGQLTDLKELKLSNNSLSGEIPTAIMNLINISTEELKLNNNCNLYSNDIDVQTYINTYHPAHFPISGYLYILSTNSHDCSLVPVIMYLLN